MLKKLLTASLLLMAVTSTGAAIPSGYGLIDYIDLGGIDGNISVSAGENMTILDEAKISELPVNSNPIGDWRSIELEPASEEVGEYLSSAGSDSSLLYPGDGIVDVSNLEDGDYALFLWSCRRNGSTGSCRWLKPRKFQIGSGGSSSPGCNPSLAINKGTDDVLRVGSTGTYSGIVNGCRGEIQEYRWEASRNENKLEETDWSRSREEFEMSIENGSRFNISFMARTDEGTVYEDTDLIWGVPEIPGDLLLSAHRAGVHAPHNTIMTIEQTRKAGANSIEFDVRVTDDGKFVVSHDRDTDKYSYGRNLVIKENPLERITEKNKGKHYEDENRLLDVSKDTAEESEYAPLDEILDYVKRYDLHMRIELKGSLQGSREKGRELYQRISNNNLIENSVFMSFRGSCPSGPGFISRDGPKESGCDWDALEAIEEASGHEAKTAMAYANRNLDDKPDLSGSWVDKAGSFATQAYGNVDSVSPTEALNYAGNQSFDMIVPADGNPRGIGGGLESYPNGISRMEFVERAREKDLDYAFMWWRGNRSDDFNRDTEQVKCGAEWISVETRSDIRRITDVEDQKFSFDISLCEFDGENRETMATAAVKTLTRFERGIGVGITQMHDGMEYIWNYPGETLDRGISGAESLIENPSPSNFWDKAKGTADQLGDPIITYHNTLNDNVRTYHRVLSRNVNDWDEATQNQQDYIVEETEQTITDPVGQADDVTNRVTNTGEDVVCGDKWYNPC